MKRREFIILLGSAAAAYPLAAHAQQPAMPVIGFLRSTSPEGSAYLVTAIRQGLNETGYVEGQNVAIEFRWAENRHDRLPALAADLVSRQVVVIIAGGNEAAVAAKAATATIPIVFSIGDDPVRLGYVANLHRPDGNITGVSFLSASALAAKRMELLRELAPKVATVGIVLNPNSPNADLERREIQTAARTLGQEIVVLSVRSDSEFEPAFTALVQHRAGALIAGGGAFFFGRRNQIVTLAARHRLPAIYNLREFTAAGGLMSYGTSIAVAYRQAGVYAGRLLKGAKPAELPVMLPTTFELVINLKTAKALGLTIPDKLLALADEVIE